MKVITFEVLEKKDVEEIVNKIVNRAVDDISNNMRDMMAECDYLFRRHDTKLTKHGNKIAEHGNTLKEHGSAIINIQTKLSHGGI